MEKKWLFYLKTIIIISKRKSTEKERSKNKLDNTKTNKRICKSNSTQSKTILNEEWYIIARELKIEERIYQNHIKHDSHLKLNPTLKEIKKSGYYWNHIEKGIREFYFKCPNCEVRTSKPRKNYPIKHIESDYSRQRHKLI